MEKTTFLHKQGLRPNYFTRCVNYNKSEFWTKQCKLYLTTTLSKIGPQHNYRGNSYVINYFFLLFKVKVFKKNTKLNAISITPKKCEIAT